MNEDVLVRVADGARHVREVRLVLEAQLGYRLRDGAVAITVAEHAGTVAITVERHDNGKQYAGVGRDFAGALAGLGHVAG